MRNIITTITTIKNYFRRPAQKPAVVYPQPSLTINSVTLELKQLAAEFQALKKA